MVFKDGTRLKTNAHPNFRNIFLDLKIINDGYRNSSLLSGSNFLRVSLEPKTWSFSGTMSLTMPGF